MTAGRPFKQWPIAHAFRARRGRFALVLIALVLILAGLAFLQHRFVHIQMNAAIRQELEGFAEQITNEIAYSNAWNLAGYRQASILAPRWFVITREGLIIDIEGFIPGFFGRVSKPTERIFESPQTVATDVGEQWRLLGRKVQGGQVLLGISSFINIADSDQKLMKEAPKFGTTIGEAAAVRSRDIDFAVDYAVISDGNELLAAWGGVPLKVEMEPVARALAAPTPFQSDRNSFFFLSKEVLNQKKEPVGTVVVLKDITAELATLRLEDKFNLIVIAGAGVVAVLLAGFLVWREVATGAYHPSLAEAVKTGEGPTVEFKSSFEWDINLNRQNKVLRLATLKTIAAFLNSAGGTVFLGVTEEVRNQPRVLGLSGDLDLAGGSTDRLLLTLRHIITDRIGSAFAPFIGSRVEKNDGQVVCVIDVERSSQPAFVRWEEAGGGASKTKFFIREGNKTSELDNETMLRYVKTRWR